MLTLPSLFAHDRAPKAVLLCGQPVEEVQGATAAGQAALEPAEGDLQGGTHAGLVVLRVLLRSQLVTMICRVAALAGCDLGSRVGRCDTAAQLACESSEGAL